MTPPEVAWRDISQPVYMMVYPYPNVLCLLAIVCTLVRNDVRPFSSPYNGNPVAPGRAEYGPTSQSGREGGTPTGNEGAQESPRCTWPAHRLPDKCLWKCSLLTILSNTTAVRAPDILLIDIHFTTVPIS